MEDNWKHNPILIYGARKSGTTLLQNLMDGHPEVLTIPGEVKLKRLVSKTLDNIGHAQGVFQKVGMSIHEINGKSKKLSFGNLTDAEVDMTFDTQKYFESLNETIEQKEEGEPHLAVAMKFTIERFLNAIKNNRVNPRYWLMKEVGSPEYEIILLYRSLFPNGKIIFIKRDYLHIVRSIVMDRRKKGVKLNRKQLLQEWKKAIKIQKMIQRLTRYPLLNFHLVEYKDLVHDTKKEMEKICSYLEIPFNEKQLSPSILGTNTTVLTASKSEQKVFKDQLHRKWYTDLTFRERAFVGLIDSAYGWFK